jgi:glutathione peroxidase
MLKKVSLALAAASLLITPGVRAAATAAAGSIYDFTFTAIDGSEIPLSAYRNKVMLLVNTASFCGYTRQYEGLQKLWENYEKQGLVVIGVPSNDFNQEPEKDAEIAKFCQGAFGVTFPLASKVSVKGDAAHPAYKWINSSLGGNSWPGWNFHKYLVSADGRTLQSFSTTVTPESSALIAAIERELEKAAAPSD